MKRVILVSFPERKLQKLFELETIQKSPYEFVEFLRKDLTKLVETENDFFANYKLADIIPIHNASGIRDLNQIGQMQEKLGRGEHIYEKDELPNIKLVLVPNGKLLLFDGTHSLLAYFNEGKKLLKEVPYLVIFGEKFSYLEAEEISCFFPEQSRELVTIDWEKYVVNWQSQPDSQLEKRESSSILDLANKLSKRNKSSVKQ